MLLFKQLLRDFLYLFFPDCCNACGVQLFQGEKELCIKCLYDLPYTDFHLYKDNAVAKLFWGRIHCNAAMAMLFFKKGTSVQTLIHRLKYQSQTNLGFTLGVLLGQRLLLSTDYHHADLIIPVPLHIKKEKKTWLQPK